MTYQTGKILWRTACVLLFGSMIGAVISASLGCVKTTAVLGCIAGAVWLTGMFVMAWDA